MLLRVYNFNGLIFYANTASLKEKSDDELRWYLHLFSQVLKGVGAALIPYKEQIITTVSCAFDSRKKSLCKEAGKILNNVCLHFSCDFSKILTCLFTPGATIFDSVLPCRLPLCTSCCMGQWRYLFNLWEEKKIRIFITYINCCHKKSLCNHIGSCGGLLRTVVIRMSNGINQCASTIPFLLGLKIINSFNCPFFVCALYQSDEEVTFANELVHQFLTQAEVRLRPLVANPR